MSNILKNYQLSTRYIDIGNFFIRNVVVINSDESIHYADNFIKKSIKRKRSTDDYNKNKEKYKEMSKMRHWSNRDVNVQISRNYYKDNRELLLEQKKNDYRNNPDVYRERNARRKNWGWKPINKIFGDCEGHHLHINNEHSMGIYIPRKIHRSVKHKHDNLESMNKINDLAIEWYNEQYNLGLFKGDAL